MPKGSYIHTVLTYHILYLHTLTTWLLPLQSCDCGDSPLCCPAGERKRASDPEEWDWRELEGASLWTHPRGAQPDTQWHGWGSVSVYCVSCTSRLHHEQRTAWKVLTLFLYFRNILDLSLSLSLLQIWTRQRSWRGSASVELSLEISHNTLQWCHASSKTVIWLVLKEESWAALLSPKYRQFSPRVPSPRGSGLGCR